MPLESQQRSDDEARRVAFDELRADRDRHRANEKRLRDAIWQYGLDHPVGSPERAWASKMLYGEGGDSQ